MRVLLLLEADAARGEGGRLHLAHATRRRGAERVAATEVVAATRAARAVLLRRRRVVQLLLLLRRPRPLVNRMKIVLAAASAPASNAPYDADAAHGHTGEGCEDE